MSPTAGQSVVAATTVAATPTEKTDDNTSVEALRTQCAELQAALRLNEFRMDALLSLSQMSGASFQGVTDFALEQAVALTKSQIGYLAFVSEDESVLTMHSWSKNAMALCRIVDKPIVYPVNMTGLWGEAVRQRRPVITNDYQAPSPLKKGCPQGHVPVLRHMNVPVFSEGRIVAVAGVGNKPEPYDDSDVRQLTLLIEGMWKLIERHRIEAELQTYRDHLQELVELRSGELVVANEELEQTNEQLQDQIRQREVADEEVRRQRDEIRKYLDIAGTIFVVLDLQGRVKLLNRKGHDILGHPQGSLLGKDWFAACLPERIRERCRAVFAKLMKGETNGCERVENAVLTSRGEERIVSWHNSILRDDTGTITGTLSSGEDVSEQRKLERELSQAHKLEAVGRLAAGIAHEINTPIQYIGDNVRFLGDCWETILALGEFCPQILEAVGNGPVPREMIDRAETMAKSLDLGFVKEEFPKAIGQSLEGVEHVAKLVSAMKEFAHPESRQMQAIDLNRALETTLTISRNEWKCVAEVVTEFDPELPPIRCLPGEINQVFLNLIVNAAQAIGAAHENKGTITVPSAWCAGGSRPCPDSPGRPDRAAPPFRRAASAVRWWAGPARP
jgi:PAS domain S-box-containing protein